MTGNRSQLFRLAASTALTATLLGGCALGGGNDRPSGYAAKPLAGKGAKSVAKAEEAVLADPRNPAVRAVLGAAYLDAGRFASAIEAYDDALELGDQSVPTVLGLALAETAQGNSQAALQLLSDWRDLIPASDLGLALALAGDTARGVEVLSGALRSGDNSPKARQNLAFAYALDGRWREAGLMAAQDVPADQVDDRIMIWARMGRPDQVRTRVAHLLGVTPVEDSGQPVALALANFPSTEQLAAEAQEQVEVAEAAPVAAPAAPVETPVAAPAFPAMLAVTELPPVAAPAAPAVRPFTFAAAPVVQPITLAAFERPRQSVASDAPAFASVPAPAARPASAATPRKAGKFVAERAKAVKPGKGKSLAALLPKAVGNGSHWVQLGSYTNPAVAREGWGKFTRRTPALKGFPAVTTTATVDGTPVWRVAATGFASYADAVKMCARVKARGGACLVKRAETNAVTRMARR